MISDGQYTLRELVRETGFSVRQIRFYISQKLVPGAGSDRGPHTRYAQETLDRLKLIARLKSEPIGPANRTRTLEEIRHELDAMTSEEIHAQAVDDLWADGPRYQSVTPSLNTVFVEHRLGYSPRPEAADELRELLSRVLRLLEDLARAAPSRQSRPDATWCRVNSPLVEVQCKVPADDDERRRLQRLASSLTALLDDFLR
jgi:DNA-binding transcriptional MerR regulator